MTDEAMANPVLREIHNEWQRYEAMLSAALEAAGKAVAARDAAMQIYYAAEQAFEKQEKP